MKHAYLIIAHNNFYVLEKLLLLLDDKRNDIYVHIDKKVKNFDFKKYEKLIKKANIKFIKKVNVIWGSYSQIKCELELLKLATKTKHKYYHLISGCDLPIKKQDEIHSFFKKQNKEFVHYREHRYYKNQGQFSKNKISKVDHYHFFLKGERKTNKINIQKNLHNILILVQEKLNLHRIKDKDYFREGANWFSITDDLARYVVSKEDEIKKQYRFTFCADEIFLQTIVYHSDFYNNLYAYNDDNHNDIKREIDWNRGIPYTYRKDDFEILINSENFFARKFGEDKVIIDMIYNYLTK